MNQQPWETRYQTSARLFSELPNSTLVSETSSLPSGRAVDIGCGEGADAMWLAARGWQVTAIDISSTALQRAAQSRPRTARNVTWIESDIVKEPVPHGPFDLVTMHYVPLLIADIDRVIPRLLEAVRPGGAFLFVTHDIDDLTTSVGFDPRRYCQPGDVAALLGPGWTISVDEKRLRDSGAQRATNHTHDAILCARREQNT